MEDGPPFQCFVNDERTRSFVALPVELTQRGAAGGAPAGAHHNIQTRPAREGRSGGAGGADNQLPQGTARGEPQAPRHLLRMIGAVNKAFVMHGLQVYYKVCEK